MADERYYMRIEYSNTAMRHCDQKAYSIIITNNLENYSPIVY